MIARAKISDCLRRQRGQSAATGGTSHQKRLSEIAQDGSSSSLPSASWTPAVRRALALIRAEFEERTWQAFWLTAAEERPAAEQLGMTAGAVRQAKYKVLRRLREELGDLL